jgi:hypothetical protein
MAIDYTALFGDIGKLVSKINSVEALGDTTLPADLLALVTQFGTRWHPAEGIAAEYDRFRDAVTGWRQSLAGYADRRVIDVETVLAELGLDDGAGPAEAVEALARQMIREAEAVKACACAAAAPAYDSANLGGGRLWLTTILDGYNPPAAGVAAQVRYNGLPSELCVSETMVFDCVGDSVIDGLAEGSEQFLWTGAAARPPLDVRAEGSGAASLSAAGGRTVLVGGGFDSFSADVPVGWTVEAGGDQISEDTSVYFRGSASMKIEGGAALVRVYQSLASGLVNGRRRYLQALAARASAAAAGATVRAYMTGTGAAVSGAISIDGASLADAWSQHGAFCTLPNPLPSDWRFVVEVEGLPAGVNLWLDDAHLVPAVYHGGVGAAVTPGATPWQRGDRITAAITNDNAGKFQSFSRKWWRAQLPSVSVAEAWPALLLPLPMMAWSAAETVADSLAN